MCFAGKVEPTCTGFAQKRARGPRNSKMVLSTVNLGPLKGASQGYLGREPVAETPSFKSWMATVCSFFPLCELSSTIASRRY